MQVQVTEPEMVGDFWPETGASLKVNEPEPSGLTVSVATDAELTS